MVSNGLLRFARNDIEAVGSGHATDQPHDAQVGAWNTAKSNDVIARSRLATRRSNVELNTPC